MIDSYGTKYREACESVLQCMRRCVNTLIPFKDNTLFNIFLGNDAMDLIEIVDILKTKGIKEAIRPLLDFSQSKGLSTSITSIIKITTTPIERTYRKLTREGAKAAVRDLAAQGLDVFEFIDARIGKGRSVLVKEAPIFSGKLSKVLGKAAKILGAPKTVWDISTTLGCWVNCEQL